MKQAADETQYDELLGELIDDVADRINSKLIHDDLRRNTYTEYHPGGTASIVLKRRFLLSVATVHDDTAHEFGSDTLVASTDYFTDESGAATIRKKSGKFQVGARNLKVIYDAGFESIPPAVRRKAVELVVSAHARRANPDMKSQGHGEGDWERIAIEDEDQRLERFLATYR